MKYRAVTAWLILTMAPPFASGQADKPLCFDARLVVELVARQPDIVHPIGLDFDQRGRLLVIESHTHFAPKGYTGPKHDRVRLLEDTDGDGRADRYSTFFEGTRATMDIAVHPDGSVYLATRNEILRLRDRDGDGKADESRRLVFLETKGDYPHNGLSGLAFDACGDLYFGLGENLGAAYKLIGADGTTHRGEGEGGNIFWCTAEGKKLRGVATGFWNPFGVHRDVFGRLFAVDNDPDSMPPCRLLHVVEGGDYGYQFRYGRSGRHPFQSWNGQLPGTLPMVAGTGEAPCEVITYESDGLPREYLGDLFVASWADHRIERYALKEKGASFTAERKPFIQGGKDFHPVGLAIAPGGSLYFSDWVLKDYNLHGRGAVWRVRMKDAKKPERPSDPRRGLLSLHRPLREHSAHRLATGKTAGVTYLREQLSRGEPRVRAAALSALMDAGDDSLDLATLAGTEKMPAIRAMAVRALVERRQDTARFLDDKHPAVQVEALAAVNDGPVLLRRFAEPDPFVRHAVARRLSQLPDYLVRADFRLKSDATRRLAMLLGNRASGQARALDALPDFLTDSEDEDLRFLAVKWIADQKLSRFRERLTEMAGNPRLSVRLYLAVATALARLDGKEVEESRMAEQFAGRLRNKDTPPAVKARLLQLLPAEHPTLSVDVLADLLDEPSVELKREAIRALSEKLTLDRIKPLTAAVRDGKLPSELRAEAMVGLALLGSDVLDTVLPFAEGENALLRDEALRVLIDAKLSQAHRQIMKRIAGQHPSSAELAGRVLRRPFANDRPAADKLDDWLKRLEGPADVDTGRRVFFHPRLGNCAGCHRIDGRGKDVGPDLSGIGRAERRHILEAILQPSNLVAPHYQAWVLETNDGRVLTGMLLRTYLDECTYLDARGGTFKLNTRDIASSQPSPTSIMPDALANLLTDQELRDLLAYLQSRR